MVDEHPHNAHEQAIPQNEFRSNSDYCEHLLQIHDPDRFYALRYGAGPERARLLGLYALQVELRNIIKAVSEPGLGEIRFHWWRENLDALQEGAPLRVHPVVQQLKLYVEALPPHRDGQTVVATDHHAQLLVCIEARSRLLYDAPFETVEDFYAWAIKSEGTFDALAASLEEAEPETVELIQTLSALLVLARDIVFANEGGQLAPHLEEQELVGFIKHNYEKAIASLNNIAPGLMPVLLPVSLIPIYLKKKRRSGFSVYRQIRYFKTTLRGRIS